MNKLVVSEKTSDVMFNKWMLNVDISYVVDLASVTYSHGYLGETLLSGLKWDMHVTDVTMKAALPCLGSNRWKGRVYQAVQYGIL